MLYLCYTTRDNFFLFFFNDTATTEIYTLSLHDALPICFEFVAARQGREQRGDKEAEHRHGQQEQQQCHGLVADRKSTRLNSSHQIISYAVFCLKKKQIKITRKLTKTDFQTDSM